MLTALLDRLTAALQGRSPKWPAARRLHLKREPECQACGETRASLLNVHHVAPVHVDPSKELDDGKDGTGKDGNMVTLCESPSHNCHLIWGHYLSWASWNVDVRKDAAAYREKLANRPTKGAA